MNLLSLLLGSSAGAPHPQFETDAQGYVVPTNQPPAAPTPMARALIPPQASTLDSPDPSAINVNGLAPDNWKPHNASVLGQIADYFLGTHFGRENEERNFEQALQAKTPMAAIRRVALFDPARAWKMYNEQVDNIRQQGSLDRQNRYMDLANENLLYGRVAGMMGAATPQTWGAMREQALRMGQARGKDLSYLIPEQYDPEAIDTIRYGAVPVKTQEQLTETARSHRANEGIRQQNADTAAERNQIMREQGSERIGISQQNADTGRMNADTAKTNAETSRKSEEKRPDKSGKSTNQQYVRDPQGNVVGMIRYEGGTPVIYHKNGGKYAVVIKNGKIVDSHYLGPIVATPQ